LPLGSWGSSEESIRQTIIDFFWQKVPVLVVRMAVRRPAVAGMFYPGTKTALLKSIEEAFRRAGVQSIPRPASDGPRKIVGLLCPHAGYMYSGHVAAAAYAKMAEDGSPQTFVVIGPNHTGLGAPVSVFERGSWETPLGLVQIDEDLAGAIIDACPVAEPDQIGHLAEHSVEVQLPFLQAIYGEARMVPVVMLDQTMSASRELGAAIAKACTALGRDCVIIASSDLTHYEPAETAERKDRAALDAILKLDEEFLYKVISAMSISMCGYGPTAAMLVAAKALGARTAELVRYSHSGETTGDYGAVVGYASAVVRR